MIGGENWHATTIGEGDPGYAVLFSDENAIHQCLGLAAITAGLPMPPGIPILQQGNSTSCYTPMYLFLCIPLGPNHAQSVINLQAWLDAIAMFCCNDNPIVLLDNGTRAQGMFHRFRQQEHTRFQAFLNRLVDWMQECRAANISCGHLLKIEPSGRGALCIIHLPCVGPFT